MTAPTDEFVQLTQRSQEAVTTAVRTWTESLQNYAGSITAEHPVPTAPDTLAVVNSWFDLAGRLLAEQRVVVTATVTRGHEALSSFTEKAGALTTSLTEKVASAVPAERVNGATGTA